MAIFANSTPEEKRYSKKICLLGDFAVGKTSLVRRFVYDLFTDRYISTIGVSVSRKTVVVPVDGRIIHVTMLLWDLSGREEFQRIWPSYLRGASGGLLVCDVTRIATLNTLLDYSAALRSLNPDVELVLAVNKSDRLIEPGSQEGYARMEDIHSLAARLEVPFFLTSAKTGDRVEDIFRQLGQQIAR